MAENNKELASKIAAKTGNGALTLKEQVANYERQFIPNLEKYVSKDDAQRLFWCMVDTARITPKVLNCNPQTILSSLVKCAQLGLFPGAMQESALIPYGEELTFQPMYQGLIKLCYQSGLVKDIACEVVYSNDFFEYMLGTEQYIKHIPADDDRGVFVGAYAVITLTYGGKIIKRMSAKEINSIRAKSANDRNAQKYNKKSIWDSDFEAMARKTVIKQAIKLAPKSNKLLQAIEIDNEQERPELSRKMPIAGIDLDLSDTGEADTTGLQEVEKVEAVEIK
jgi:recombination protein RecT